jgi:hypothetical protein
MRALLACSVMLAGAGAVVAKDAPVQVQARVEVTAKASGPVSIELEPGESRTMTVRIAANIPWRLAVATDNPAIRAVASETTGHRGGYSAPGNTLQVEFLCDPSAPGKQVAVVEYSLVRR